MLGGAFDAVFGDGRGSRESDGNRGGNTHGHYSATELLVRGNLAPDRCRRCREVLPGLANVVVISGSDTSMDCVRTAIRLGAETQLLVEAEIRAEAKTQRARRGREVRDTDASNADYQR